MKQNLIQVEKVNTKCYDCKKETQCFIDHETLENGSIYDSDPRCKSCYKRDKLEWEFEYIFGSMNVDDEKAAIMSMIPVLKRLSDEELCGFLKYVGSRMEF